MAKFHIKLKIQGFELEVDGTRDELPVLREALSQQFAGLLQPATEIAGGEVVNDVRRIEPSTPPAIVTTAKAKRRARTSAPSSGGVASGKETAADWRHDTSKYPSPTQAWTTAQKSIWTLYVASKEADVPEMSAKRIELTFNKHFRQAGVVRANNVLRDLGKLKTGSNGEPALVSQDTTKDPSTWYLTDAGIRSAQKLIAQGLGQTGEAA